MIPELPIFMLACARIGAIHTIIFSGFSAQALADRINDVQGKLLVLLKAALKTLTLLIVNQALPIHPFVVS